MNKFIILLVVLLYGGLFFSPILFIIALTLISVRTIREKYVGNETGNEMENEYPYAMDHGQVVGGAVYASDPENDPGLGWVL